MAARTVLPATLARLKNLSLVARLVVEGFLAGQHKSPFFGFNVEFTEHRPYMPGDDIRHVDWKLWAKIGRLYIKQYEENTCLRCIILLDVSRSMDHFEGQTDAPSSDARDLAGPDAARVSKLTYAQFLAASLAYLMLYQRDAVGLVTFSDRVHAFVHPRAHPSHLHLVLDAIEQSRGGGRTDISNVIQEVAGRIKRRALVVVVSDLLDDYEKVIRGVKYLKYLKHEPILFQVLTPDELDLGAHADVTEFVDLEDGRTLTLDPRTFREEYKRRMEALERAIVTEASFHKIDHALFTTHDPLEAALSRYLVRRSRS